MGMDQREGWYGGLKSCRNSPDRLYFLCETEGFSSLDIFEPFVSQVPRLRETEVRCDRGLREGEVWNI